MSQELSIAIETSCRVGGVALGRGDQLVAVIEFNASARHATQLLRRLDDMVRSVGATPGELAHVYVSAGPGSFTGLRVGITVARTLGQAIAHLRCVAVPTPLAVAQNVAALDWQRLGVILDAKEDLIYAERFVRQGDEIVPETEPQVISVKDFLASTPRPILLTGEGLGYHDLRSEGIHIADAAVHMPTARSVWTVGRRLARAGAFTDYNHLLPIYTRKPEALRLWEARQAAKDAT